MNFLVSILMIPVAVIAAVVALGFGLIVSFAAAIVDVIGIIFAACALVALAGVGVLFLLAKLFVKVTKPRK